MTESIQKFKYKQLINFDFLISNWNQFQQKCSNFPRYPLQPRLYNHINEYHSVLENTEYNVNKLYNIEQILKSDLKPQCKKNCSCNKTNIKLEDFSECVLNESTWKSDCIDKCLKIECDNNCGCNSMCKNRALQKKDYIQENLNIKVQLVWGIDMYTRKNLYYLLPNELCQKKKNEIINKILKSMNFFDKEGWNITKVLELNIKQCEKRFEENQMKQQNTKSTKSYTLSKQISNQSRIDSDFKVFCQNNSFVKKNMKNKSKSISSQFSKKSKIKINQEKIKKFQVSQKESQKTKSNLKQNFIEDLLLEKKDLIENIQLFNESLEKFGVTLQEEQFCYQMLYKYSKIKQLRQGLRIHSKGLGVICQSPQGIKKNTLISAYHGEVYPSWYWTIKQDAIKNFLDGVKRDKYKKFKEFKNNYNIDFYNILVEKIQQEPKGRDIFVIDPIINGNFASRLSHSCEPNCWAIPVISKGQYMIAMYAIKDIDYTEELTFDYCSFTESEKEYLNSICLCGVENCKTYFLGYTKIHESFFQNEIKNHLIDFNSKMMLQSYALVFKACKENLTTEKFNFLKENKFGENTFKNSPEWVKNWTYYQLLEINKEKKFLNEKLKEKENDLQQQENLKFTLEIENLYFQRIHNIIITIDKIRNFCVNQPENLKNVVPLQNLSLKNYLIFQKQLLNILGQNKFVKDNKEIVNLIKEANSNNFKIKDHLRDLKIPKKLQQLIFTKFVLLQIAIYFKEFKDDLKNNFTVLSYLLFFQAFTIQKFFHTDYQPFEIMVNIRKCDLTNPKKNLLFNNLSKKTQIENLEKVLISIPKKINTNYLWKQLIYWASLSNEKSDISFNLLRQGVLSYPSFENLLGDVKRVDKCQKFPFQKKEIWLEKILNQPSEFWPNVENLVYEKFDKTLGTIVFDDLYLNENNRKYILNIIQKGKNQIIQYFEEFWKKFHNNLSE